jgi:hypothetical protein
MQPRETCFITRIETTVEGQQICGLVIHQSSSDIDVMITSPFDGYVAGLHLPYFARGVHPDGFDGAYGRQRAKELLKQLYLQHKDCPCRQTSGG